VIAGGCAVLLARPVLLERSADPVALLAVVFAGLLAVGVMTRAPRAVAATSLAPATVLAIGVGAFALGRMLVSADAPAPATPLVVSMLVLAAVAEEAFFRRLVFGSLTRFGPVAQVVGSAWLFAIVHVTVYGWYALPLDLAAGLLLSWQRWASGSWAAPAATHALANVIGVL
jgi:membrane protease YdiL (CAAX protease family)